MSQIEIYKSKDYGVTFYFTHSDQDFTTGLMVIAAHYELPKHNRPLAVENLVQISGTCLMKLFTDETNFTEHILQKGDHLVISQGQYHIHANPHDIESVTLFKAAGDITAVMDILRKEFDFVKSL